MGSQSQTRLSDQAERSTNIRRTANLTLWLSMLAWHQPIRTLILHHPTSQVAKIACEYFPQSFVKNSCFSAVSVLKVGRRAGRQRAVVSSWLERSDSAWERWVIQGLANNLAATSQASSCLTFAQPSPWVGLQSLGSQKRRTGLSD